MIRSVPKASSCLMYSRGEIQAYRQLAVLTHIAPPCSLSDLPAQYGKLSRRVDGCASLTTFGQMSRHIIDGDRPC